MKVVYEGQAHRLLVGETYLPKNEEMEVSEEVFRLIKDRQDVRVISDDESGEQEPENYFDDMGGES